MTPARPRLPLPSPTPMTAVPDAPIVPSPDDVDAAPDPTTAATPPTTAPPAPIRRVGRGRTRQARRIRQDRFIAAYVNLGTVAHAARQVGIDRTTHYDWLKIDADYARRFAAAEEDAVDRLELVARSRALNGSERLLTYLLDRHRYQRTGGPRTILEEEAAGDDEASALADAWEAYLAGRGDMAAEAARGSSLPEPTDAD